jgi:hypothetical protein
LAKLHNETGIGSIGHRLTKSFPGLPNPGVDFVHLLLSLIHLNHLNGQLILGPLDGFLP